MNSDLIGIRGSLLDTPEYGKLRFWRDGALVLDHGLIAEVGEYDALRKKPRAEAVRWIHHANRVLFPGLIDLHAHVPQYPAVARGQNELLPWLRQHIFPLEREFTGPKGRKLAAPFFDELVRHGTTTAMLYTAIYEDTCDVAFAAAEKVGLRVIMGKTMMDIGSYGQLQPKKVVSISLLERERLCKKWNRANNGLLDYAFSPRFAVSCSEKLMRGAAELACEHGAYLQTHLAENLEEIEKVRAQFAWASDYTEVYEKCGLLGRRTVLAHCLHLSERERRAISDSGAAVAHCPTANLFLGSGVLPLDVVRAAGTHVGLGSDVAAGPELNLWQVMRSCIESQRIRSYYEKGVSVPTAAEAFFLATQGSANALGKGEIIGSFEIGKEADIVIIDPLVLLPGRKSVKALADMSPEDILSLCVYRGGAHAVVESRVRGNPVFRAPEPELF